MGRLYRLSARVKTPRPSGRSLSEIINDVNRTLSGCYEYLKHSDPRTFAPLDGWVRMRLSSI